jgi:rubrerythrin
MREIEKLRRLLEHWAEHEAGHRQEYLRWAQRAQEEGLSGPARLLREAARQSQGTEALFKEALRQLP